MGREAILDLIPHGPGMCLLDEITHWDRERILCRASTHRDPNNPLRDGAGLPAFCALEYGAQAMAAHGALLARSQGLGAQPAPPGSLVSGTQAPGRLVSLWLISVRDARFLSPRLDTYEGALEVEARAGGSGGGAIAYDISLSHGETLIASARLLAAAAA